jgi:hypothetical protein
VNAAPGGLPCLGLGAVKVHEAHREAVGGKALDDGMGLDQPDGEETEESGVEQYGNSE